MTKSIAQIVVGLPLEGPFDYSIGDELLPEVLIGKRVYVSFNRRKRIGYVTGLIEESKFGKLNPILSVLDETPSLNKITLQFTKEFSQYYGCSWGEAIETYLPAFLRKSKYIVERIEEVVAVEGRGVASELLCELDSQKKWEYIGSQIAEMIKGKKGVILLAPELSQIKKVVKEIELVAGAQIAVVDKKISVKKEKEQWELIRRGKINVVVGTRSAIFSPVQNLGLIIITNEDNPSYKQEQSPFYHVNKVADIRSKIEECKVILESVTPSVETWFYHEKKRVLTEIAGSCLSEMQIIDMNNYNPQKSSLLSPPLQNKIRSSLEKKEKMLLLMNRKGFSTITSCNECGFSLQCPRCNVNLVYMSSAKTMMCTHCNHAESLPSVCPQCNHSYLRSFGVGIEKMASHIGKFFFDAQVAVFDKDTKRVPKGADIIIATQAILKVCDDMRFDSIVILDFDAELNRFNFRSSQEAFSKLIHLRLLAQSGLFVQTRNPDSECVKAAIDGSFDKFYFQELKCREELGFPPYKHMVEIIIRGNKEESVSKYSQELFALLEKNLIQGVDIMEPQPDSMPKLRDQYRYNIMLKSESPDKMLADIKTSLKEKKGRNIIVTVNMDP